MFLLSIAFISTNIVFSFILYSFIMSLNQEREFCGKELLLYSLGLGPIFTALILYYSFLLVPYHSNLFYSMFVLLVYSIIAILSKEYWVGLIFNLKHYKLIALIKEYIPCKVVDILLLVSISVPVLYYFSIYFTSIIHQPLRDFDILDYAISGEMLFTDKSLQPIWIQDFSPRGYAYKILHAPSFSLLFAWELILNSFWQIKSDLYFKSISVYYAGLLLLVHYYWVAKQNKYVAIVSSIALVSCLFFFKTLLRPHIDSYRVFFVTMSFIWLAYSVKKPSLFAILLFGVFSGCSAFSHRIGLVLAIINLSVFGLMVRVTLMRRVVFVGVVLCVICLFGGGHYLIDLYFGKGQWLLKK